MQGVLLALTICTWGWGGKSVCCFLVAFLRSGEPFGVPRASRCQPAL